MPKNKKRWGKHVWGIVVICLCLFTLFRSSILMAALSSWVSTMRAEVAYMPEALSIMMLINAVGILYVRRWRKAHHLHAGR